MVTCGKKGQAFDYNGNLIIKYKWDRNSHGKMQMVIANSRLNYFYAVLQFKVFCGHTVLSGLHVKYVP